MPYNETAYKASQKYKAGNIKRVPLDMQISKYEKIKAHAEAQGESVNGFIKRAIDSQISQDRDKGPSGARQGPSGGSVVSLPSEAYKCAVEASTASGEELPDFVARAVVTQAKRDETARKLGEGK